MSDFSYIIERAFGNTISVLMAVLLVVFVVIFVVGWAIVPFVLISIRRKLSEIDEKLSKRDKE